MAKFIYLEKNNISLLVAKSDTKKIADLTHEGYTIMTSNGEAVEVDSSDLTNGNGTTGDAALDALLGFGTKTKSKIKAGLN